MGEFEAGVDEAGRGCLAGEVYAAAVILPLDFTHPLLNDSKKMTSRNRLILRDYIQTHALAWAVAEVSAQEIDQINILNATFRAMNAAVLKLGRKPLRVLIDGNRFRSQLPYEHHCIVGGDGLYASIAAASVLAKTYRDDRMAELDALYPCYGWKKNKGYPTLEHRRAILEHGVSPYHRLTFAGVEQNALF